jgi:16S rRNA (adenine1518-N6/adenine1519-N6)-dimethyltransferase
VTPESLQPLPLAVPKLLQKYGLKPDKRLGQNFLVDEAALNKIVEAASLAPEDQVLEIGPGVGSLTRYLCRAARRVVAVELDERLLPAAREVLAPYANLELLQGDILAFDPGELMRGNAYRVVANIPYYITSAVMRHLMEAAVRPERVVLTVQREVAERICASPGEMSLLAVSVQYYGQPQIAARIPAGAFFPVPKVDSAVVRVDVLPEPRLPEDLQEKFFKLARAGFSQKRKTLRNALAAGLKWSHADVESLLSAAGIDPRRRAETLSIQEWVELASCQPG